MQERFSNVSNNRFFNWGHFQKTFLVRQNFISNANLGQTSYLDFTNLASVTTFLIAYVHILSYGPTGLGQGSIFTHLP